MDSISECHDLGVFDKVVRLVREAPLERIIRDLSTAGLQPALPFYAVMLGPRGIGFQPVGQLSSDAEIKGVRTGSGLFVFSGITICRWNGSNLGSPART